jgi:hypothetical protein
VSQKRVAKTTIFMSAVNQTRQISDGQSTARQIHLVELHNAHVRIWTQQRLEGKMKVESQQKDAEELTQFKPEAIKNRGDQTNTRSK